LGPRSTALMVVLGMAAATLLAGMLWLWPALARRRAGAVLARIALLGGLQLSVLGLVFVYVNRTYEFYASWSDLFGTNYVAGKIVAVQQGAGGAGAGAPGAGSQSAGWLSAGGLSAGGLSARQHGAGRPAGGKPAGGKPAGGKPAGGKPAGGKPGGGLAAPGNRISSAVMIASTPVAVPGARRGAGGWLETVRFTGPVSGITTTGYVYLPGAYAHTTGALPVIVVISGQAGRSAAAGAAQVAATAGTEMKAHRLGPAVVAMLPAAVAGRSDQGCLDVPGGPQAATFFSQDLPLALAQAYRVVSGPSGWGVLGGVGGGYCALQLATAPSAPFAVAAVRPGTYTTPPGQLSPATGPWLRSQDNLLWRLRTWPPPPVRVLFAGPGQPRQFLSLVRPPMSAATTSLAAGFSPLAPVLDWIGHALTGRA
jgi:hypothetical protein